MSEQINNLTFWESVEKTDPKKTKKAQKGALKLTAINATSQIKAATEKWGQYGDTWGLSNIDYTFMDIGDTKLALIKATFYYPSNRTGLTEGFVGGDVAEFPINSSLKMVYMPQGKDYLKIDDDFCKKLETDVTTKALSKLGFNTDVFMGLYDDNKYVMAMQEEFHPTPPPKKLKISDKQLTQAKERVSKMTEDKPVNDLIKKLIETFDLEQEVAEDIYKSFKKDA